MASVNYSIKGKYDKKAVEQAKSGFKSLQDSIKSLNAAIGGFAALKAVQAVNKLTDVTKGIFLQQNEAVVKFNTAVAKTNLNLSKLQTIQNKVSRNNLFDGDAINNASTFAVSLKLTEEQFEKVMNAATDMAASGIMPLDNAVKALSLSYSGNVSQLKKIAPEMENLTKQQLKSGAAVDILAGKYAGFADALAGTFSGRNTQWKNSIDDLKAAIGSIPTSLEFITQGKLLEPLNKVTEWITNNRDYVLNFFIHLPEVAKVSFKAIQEGMKKLFSKEGLDSIVKAIVDSMTNVGATTLSIFSEVIKGVIKMIKEFTTNLETGDLGTLLLNAWYKVCNQLNEMFFKVFDVAYELINGGGLTDAVKVAMGTKTGKIAGSLHYDYKSVDTTKAIEAVTKVVSDMGKNITGLSTDLVEKQKGVLVTFLDNFQGIGEDAFNEIKGILGKDLPEDLKKALSGITYNGSGTGNGGSSGSGLTTDNKKTLLSGMGQIGTYASAFGENGVSGIIIQLIKDVVSQLSSVSDVVNKTLNVVSFLIKEIAEPLVKVLEPVLIPILSVVKSIGSVIGSIVSIFAPFARLAGWALEVIAKILFWVQTFFVSLFDTIRYGFVEIENWIIKIYNKLTGWFASHVNEREQSKSWGEISTQWQSLVDKELFDRIFYASMEAGTGGSYASASTGSGASYTAARDNIVYFTYNNSFVNGDAREIAIAMKHEMDQASRMGYL